MNTIEAADGRLRVFLSLPFRGRSNDDIEKSIEGMRKWFFATQTVDGRSYNYNEIQFVDNHKFSPETDGITDVPSKVFTSATSVYCLGEAIKMMARCDLVVFSPDWINATGCRMEMDICRAYHRPYIIMGCENGGCGVAG